MAFLSGALLAWLLNDSAPLKQLMQSFQVEQSQDIASLGTSKIGDITLTDHDNQQLKLSSFLGKTVVLSFMFNGCSPVQTVGLRRTFLDHQLDAQDKGITFLSISVAPETDTPELLKSFAVRYGIDAKNWRLGITDRQSLDRLLLSFNAGQALDNDPNSHLNTVFLINKEGEKLKVYKGFPISPATVYADLEKYIAKE